MCCDSWGRKESDTLSGFTFTFHFPALEKEMAAHSSVLAWRIPGTGETGGLLSMGGRCTEVAVPLRVVPSPTGLPSKRGPGKFGKLSTGLE